jgi:hypothetical protein
MGVVATYQAAASPRPASPVSAQPAAPLEVDLNKVVKQPEFPRTPQQKPALAC